MTATRVPAPLCPPVCHAALWVARVPSEVTSVITGRGSLTRSTPSEVARAARRSRRTSALTRSAASRTTVPPTASTAARAAARDRASTTTVTLPVVAPDAACTDVPIADPPASSMREEARPGIWPVFSGRSLWVGIRTCDSGSSFGGAAEEGVEIAGRTPRRSPTASTPPAVRPARRA
jgi:hypothetical protein